VAWAWCVLVASLIYLYPRECLCLLLLVLFSWAAAFSKRIYRGNKILLSLNLGGGKDRISTMAEYGLSLTLAYGVSVIELASRLVAQKFADVTAGSLFGERRCNSTPAGRAALAAGWLRASSTFFAVVWAGGGRGEARWRKGNIGR